MDDKNEPDRGKRPIIILNRHPDQVVCPENGAYKDHRSQVLGSVEAVARSRGELGVNRGRVLDIPHFCVFKGQSVVPRFREPCHAPVSLFDAIERVDCEGRASTTDIYILDLVDAVEQMDYERRTSATHVKVKSPSSISGLLLAAWTLLNDHGWLV